ncbi:hypothetical protein BDV24DRAFT_126823 [Aspergillus arachidicola]|uniref:Uncharacterized protein n=1 Tax=Aspergillus arachidicola TaxID=656916 RepID=A0A5N6YJ63_9EURO|nr:hypothetical protein BDV24DRAFT_126823 [Aspergillus arachidicola]
MFFKIFLSTYHVPILQPFGLSRTTHLVMHVYHFFSNYYHWVTSTLLQLDQT